MPVSEGEEIETWGDPGRGTVIKPTDESGVSKAVPLCCWNNMPTGIKKKETTCSHLPSQLQTSLRLGWEARE